MNTYEIVPNRTDHTWELYINEHFYGAFVSLTDATRRREVFEAEDERAAESERDEPENSWPSDEEICRREHFNREDERAAQPLKESI